MCKKKGLRIIFCISLVLLLSLNIVCAACLTRQGLSDEVDRRFSEMTEQQRTYLSEHILKAAINDLDPNLDVSSMSFDEMWAEFERLKADQALEDAFVGQRYVKQERNPWTLWITKRDVTYNVLNYDAETGAYNVERVIGDSKKTVVMSQSEVFLLDADNIDRM